MLGIVTKQPADYLDYDISFADWIADEDVIESADVTIAPADELTVGEIQIFSPTVKVWLAGGVNGGSYKATLIATTTQGRIKEVEFKIRVRDY